MFKKTIATIAVLLMSFSTLSTHAESSLEGEKENKSFIKKFYDYAPSGLFTVIAGATAWFAYNKYQPQNQKPSAPRRQPGSLEITQEKASELLEMQFSGAGAASFNGDLYMGTINIDQTPYPKNQQIETSESTTESTSIETQPQITVTSWQTIEQITEHLPLLFANNPFLLHRLYQAMEIGFHVLAEEHMESAWNVINGMLDQEGYDLLPVDMLVIETSAAGATEMLASIMKLTQNRFHVHQAFLVWKMREFLLNNLSLWRQTAALGPLSFLPRLIGSSDDCRRVLLHLEWLLQEAGLPWGQIAPMEFQRPLDWFPSASQEVWPNKKRNRMVNRRVFPHLFMNGVNLLMLEIQLLGIDDEADKPTDIRPNGMSFVFQWLCPSFTLPIPKQFQKEVESFRKYLLSEPKLAEQLEILNRLRKCQMDEKQAKIIDTDCAYLTKEALCWGPFWWGDYDYADTENEFTLGWMGYLSGGSIKGIFPCRKYDEEAKGLGDFLEDPEYPMLLIEGANLFLSERQKKV